MMCSQTQFLDLTPTRLLNMTKTTFALYIPAKQSKNSSKYTVFKVSTLREELRSGHLSIIA